jgi:predicted extracellular nuclease
MKRYHLTICLLALALVMATCLRPATSRAATIAYTSFEEPGTGDIYIDTDIGGAATDHALINNVGEAPVNYTSTGGELGFFSYYYNTRNDEGLTDGDHVGVTDYASVVGAYPDGSYGFEIQDADGAMRTTLDTVSLAGYTDVEVSVQYFVQETGWETAPEDVLHIWVEVDGGATIDLINTAGSDIDDLGIEGSWRTVTQSLAGYTQATLHFELDSNAAAESVWFDSVLFSGTSTIDHPPQVTTTTPSNGATDVNSSTAITVNFDENVDLTASAMSLACPAGSPVAFTGLPANNTPSVTLVLTSSLPSLTTCTVTVVASETTDLDGTVDQLDGDGDGTGGDNYVFTFTTAASTSCGDPATLIHDIQGSTATSPEEGNTHTIEGIVVGDFQRIIGNDRLSGFFVQEESGDWDADAATSEGIFVYEGSSSLLDVGVGDKVRFSGVVNEYHELTEIGSLNYLSLCSTGNTVTAVSVTLPETVDGDLERYEGMRVSIESPIVVAQTYYLGRYGQMTLSAGGRLYQPTNQYAPGSTEAQNLADANARSLLILDDGMDVDACGENPDPVPYLGSPPPNVIRAGDTVTNLVGVLDYGQINSGNDGSCSQPGTAFARDYRLHPVQAPAFTPVNARPAAPGSVGGSIKVASFNVLNYFNGNGLGGGFPTSRGADTLSEFNRQSDKIVDAIVTLDADIVGLMELENDGFGANSAIQELVDRLNAVTGAGTYAFVDPGVSAIGDDEITVGLIYKPGSVTPVGSAAILDRTSFTDPNSLGSQQNRPALAQTFEDNASTERFTVVVNHLKSKGSACGPGDDDLTTGQGNCNGTRTAGVADQIAWLSSDPTGSGDPDFVILGDLNAYAQEDPIAEFTSNGYTNLVDQCLGATAYSYVFDGQVGYLDHALANGTMASQVTDVTQWHINADEPPVIDYDQDFNPPGYYSANPYRSSDHDPVLIGLNLTSSNQPPVADAGPDQSVNTNTPVTLNGSGSSDSDGNLPLTYHWTQTGGPAVAFTPNLSITAFIAPSDSVVLTFTLAVTDSLSLPDPTPDEVVVTVEGYRIYLPLVVQHDESPDGPYINLSEALIPGRTSARSFGRLIPGEIATQTGYH